MKLLAIADTYIPAETMRAGLAPLADCGVEVVVRQWAHESLIALQEANLAIEQGGPEAVPLPDDLAADLETFTFLVVQFAPVPARWLQQATALRVIGVLRGGTENVDVAAATARGICVLNTPGRNARAVAECTLGLILAEIRNLARSHAALRQGRWERQFPNSQEIPELYGKTVGLIGYGAVARLVAHYLIAFGSRIIAYDPYCQGDPAPATLVSLDQLLRTSDIISLHARLTADNQHLLGAAELAQMKPTAVLVNTARSGLIDEAALVEALQAGRIQGAALDVFDCEPLPVDHPLLRLPNVTITPHLAGSTIDAFRNSPRLLAGHLARLLAGDEHVPIINHVRPTWPTATS